MRSTVIFMLLILKGKLKSFDTLLCYQTVFSIRPWRCRLFDFVTRAWVFTSPVWIDEGTVNNEAVLQQFDYFPCNYQYWSCAVCLHPVPSSPALSAVVVLMSLWLPFGLANGLAEWNIVFQIDALFVRSCGPLIASRVKWSQNIKGEKMAVFICLNRHLELPMSNISPQQLFSIHI